MIILQAFRTCVDSLNFGKLCMAELTDLIKLRIFEGTILKFRFPRSSRSKFVILFDDIALKPGNGYPGQIFFAIA